MAYPMKPSKIVYETPDSHRESAGTLLTGLSTVKPRRISTAPRFGRSSRYYDTPDGLLPSVTTILSVVGKPALINWAANTERTLVIEASANLYEDLMAGALAKMTRVAYLDTLQRRIGTVKAHQREMAKASEIGSQTHTMIEWHLRKELGQAVGPEPSISDKALWAFMVYEDWRQKVHLVPRAIEQTVWHPIRKYAGTMDLLADMDLDGLPRGPVVLDWKTGKGIYEEALLQNSAYVHALIAMGHAAPPVHGVVVRLPKVDTDPEPEAKIIPWELQQQLYPVFLAVKLLWSFMDEREEDRAKKTTSVGS